ncbi:MAG: thioredoxin domain-containing protein [Alphaproteobacteria bacterium]|nr:thioredoxin domain-containing protein [Alphaproteobacteria bacterium]
MPLRPRLPPAMPAPAAVSRRPRLGRRIAAALAGLLLATAPLLPAAAAEIGQAERQQIEAIIHDYLMQHPDVLMEALQAAEDKLKGEEQEKASKAVVERRQQILNDAATPVGGNPNGDVSVVEFFDYRCPYCKQVEPSLEKLLAEDQQLRFVYKEMPVLGPESVIAARAALAARNQGKYLAFHIAMMNTKGQIGEDTVYTVAASVGLDLDRLKRDMAAPEIEMALKSNLDLADQLDIRGTPGFVIGNQIVPGAVDIAALRQFIDDARNGK